MPTPPVDAAMMRGLPGERVVLELRPHAASHVGAYLLAASPGVAAVALWLLFASSAWQSLGNGVLGTGLAGGLAVVVLAAVAGVGWLAWRRWTVIAAYTLAAVAVAVAAVFLDVVVAVPVGLASVALAGLVIADVVRRRTVTYATNVRLVHEAGLWPRRSQQVRYSAVLDIDVAQTPWSRLFHYATLHPVTGESAPEAKEPGGSLRRLRGIHPMPEALRTIESLIGEATTPADQRATLRTSAPEPTRLGNRFA